MIESKRTKIISAVHIKYFVSDILEWKKVRGRKEIDREIHYRENQKNTKYISTEL